MDSLTQMALGGAVGYAVIGSKVGRKAILWGAALGTLPDLDVLLPYSDAVEAFTYHRGFSHSLLVHLLISPLITWLILKFHNDTQEYKNKWFCLVFLSLSTHALLDSFTVYGTQLMWPISEYPVGISSIFIIDPLYTLPLLFGLAFALFPKVSAQTTTRMNTIGLFISSLYLSWSLVAKVYIDHKVELALAAANITSTAYVSTPAPFTTLLWRIVVMSDNKYYEAYASVFDTPSQISLSDYPTYPSLLANIDDEWGVQRLQWFTKGLYSIRQKQDAIILSDLRMGVECSYIFNFEVGKKTPSGIQVGSYQQSNTQPDFSKLPLIWERIYKPNIVLSPNSLHATC